MAGELIQRWPDAASAVDVLRRLPMPFAIMQIGGGVAALLRDAKERLRHAQVSEGANRRGHLPCSVNTEGVVTPRRCARRSCAPSHCKRAPKCSPGAAVASLSAMRPRAPRVAAESVTRPSRGSPMVAAITRDACMAVGCHPWRITMHELHAAAVAPGNS